MSSRIILHIGTNKTGTSAIQFFLGHKFDELWKNDVLYPLSGRSGRTHHPISRLLGFGPPLDIDDSTRERSLKETKLSLIKEISERDFRAVIMSSENFMLPRSIEPVVRFFRDMDVQIVLYLRRHDHWRESAYSQGLRMVANPPWEKGFEGWLNFQSQSNPRYGNFRLLVDNWAKAFGKENLIIRPYEKQQNKPNLVADFLGSTSLQEIEDKMETAVPRINESLSIKAKGLLDVFQRLETDPEKRKLLVKYAMDLEPDAKKISVVPPVLRRKLVDSNVDDYTYIAREYLGRKDGRLFYESLPDPEEPWEPPRTLSQVEIEENIAKALG